MNSNKNFFLNGHKFSTNHQLTISDILHYFNYTNNLFIIENNSLICNRKKWSNIQINSNDKIEVISIVGGG